MTLSAALRARDRSHTAITDALGVLLAVSLPWSTTATGILAALFLVALLIGLEPRRLSELRSQPAAWLPVALALLGLIGLAWSEAPLAEGFRALSSFAKLLLLPLILLHFRQSARAHWLLLGYLGSCTALLLASSLPIAVPPLRWMWGREYGIPVKDYISQSGAFVTAMFVALHLAVSALRRGEPLAAFGLGALALLFLSNVLYVTTARTTLVALPLLLVLFAVMHFGWRGIAATLALGAVTAAFAWASSPYLRARVAAIPAEVERYLAQDERTSSGERLEFWTKSVRFIATAPVFGHGTGATLTLFRKAARGEDGAGALVTANPHNQTLAVGVQLGLLGIAVLWAMWIAHLALFLRGDGFVAWFGLLVVAHTMIGAAFNSLLFDFTQGWTYVVIVGAAAGAVLRARASAREADTHAAP
jgi:O-antigen ligase